MKVWNVGKEGINQLYNNLNYIIPAETIKEISDDIGTFLLSKRNIRGVGLVQLKDGDNKEERYKQGRKQIYDWAVEKYADYEKHCEERKGINQAELRPHQAILDYKKTIEEYEKWIEEGSKVVDEFKEIVGEIKVFVCPECLKEFKTKEEYLQHTVSHRQFKEEVVVNTGAITDKSQRKS